MGHALFIVFHVTGSFLPSSFDTATTPVLYHYTSIAAARAMVDTSEIWLSEHTAMNDASEFTYARDQLYALLRHRAVPTNQVVRLALVFAVEGLAEGTGLMLASLTRRADDLGQWRSYGANGGGCVLGVDAAFLEHDAGVAIRSVVYDEDLVDRALKAAITVVQEQHAAASGDVNELAEFCRHAAADLFNIKHPCFADEREVRIARMLVRDGEGALRDVGGNRSDGSLVSPLEVLNRQGAFGPTAYIALPLIGPGGASAIRSVGFGPAMSESEWRNQTAWFAGRGLDVWRSALPYRA